MDIPRFHIAFPVNNLKSTRDFFTKVLGCSLGRESDKWIDFNMYGHQVVAHFSPEDCIKSNFRVSELLIFLIISIFGFAFDEE